MQHVLICCSVPSVADLTLQQSSLYMLQHAISSRLDAACSMYVYILYGEVADLTLRHAVQCVCVSMYGEVADLTELTRAACSCIYAVQPNCCRLQQDERSTVHVSVVVKSAGSQLDRTFCSAQLLI